MYEELSARLRRSATSLGVELCWAQWSGLGSWARPGELGPARSIVDVEALILSSLHLSAEERRLGDLVAWWASVGSHLTSVQRLRSVAEGLPGDAGEQAVGRFAALATAAGDRRWARHAATERPAGAVREGKGPDTVELLEPAALWPRLRAGFGVGAKADVLTVLLGLDGGWATVSRLAFATGYSEVAVGRAAGEMAVARLLRSTEGRPVEFQAPPKPWGELLELGASRHGPAVGAAGTGWPAWRPWSHLLAFLTRTLHWCEAVESDATSAPVLASRARDIGEAAEPAFLLAGVPAPRPDAFRGREAPGLLVKMVEVVGAWVREAV
jgi:hypothetical protein